MCHATRLVAAILGTDISMECLTKGKLLFGSCIQVHVAFKAKVAGDLSGDA